MPGVSYACATPAARPLTAPHHASAPHPLSPPRCAPPSLHTPQLKCRLPNSSRRCVTEGGQLLGVLTRLDLVENAKGMMRSPREAAAQMKTVACLGISRGNLLESNSSSRRSSTGSAASCDAKTELL